MLLVWTRDYPDPTLPKGRLEPGELSAHAATREVREETGYDVSVVDSEPVTVEVLLTAHPPAMRKVIDFYLAHPVPEAALGPVEPPISRAAWVPVDRAVKLMLRAEEVNALRECVKKADKTQAMMRGKGDVPAY